MPIGTQLTLAGAVLLSKAIAGKQLTFTRGAFGDAKVNGQVVEPTDEQKDNLNALINERMSLPIYAYEITDAGDIVVSVKVKNEGVTSKFKAVETGLFALDPDTQQEILYGYCYDGADADTIHAKSSYCVLEYYVELVTTIANAQNVTCNVTIKEKIQAGAGLSRMGDTISANCGQGISISAYNNLFLKTATATEKGGVRITGNDGLEMDGATLKANYNNLPTASESIKGGIKVGMNLFMTGESLNSSVEAYDDSLLQSRLSQLEINLSNVFTKLNANNLDATANLLLVEDWKANKATNLYSDEIDAAYTSDRLPRVAIHNATTCAEPGQIITLTSRGKSQELQIIEMHSAVEPEDSLTSFYVYFDQPIDENLFRPGSVQTIDDGFLYRTTAAVTSAYAYGPGKLAKNRVTFGTAWRGTIRSQVKSLNLPHGSNDYTIQGDGELSGNLSDGYTFSIV